MVSLLRLLSMQIVDAIKTLDPTSCVWASTLHVGKVFFLWLCSNNHNYYICIPTLVPLPTLTCLCTSSPSKQCEFVILKPTHWELAGRQRLKGSIFDSQIERKGRLARRKERNGTSLGADHYLCVDKRASAWRLAFLPTAFCAFPRAIWVQLSRIIEAAPSGIERWIPAGGDGVM